MERIDRDTGEPPWMQLRDNLRRAIMSGELTGRLSARQVGQENDGMAVNTVTKALRALQAEGLVEPRAGWGWVVTPAAARPAPPGGGTGPGD
jgi:DNA-binding GntR family transcriptional regulator